MPHRTVRDDAGRTWEIWEVQPENTERRRGRDRRHTQRPDAVDRRTRREARLFAPPGYEHGWIAFLCETERRRLAPPPPAWPMLPDDALLALLSQAVISSPARRLIG